MKKLIVLMLSLCLLLPAFALADDLTVNGSATVTVPADMAQVVLGVVTKAETVQEATAQNADALAMVIDALKAAGIAEEDMLTENYSVSAQYGYSYGKLDNEQNVTGFQVSNLLRVTVRDVAQVGALVDNAMKHGANECYGITFQSTNSEKAYDQALQAAVTEGARKAALLAKAAGLTLGALEEVTEQGGSYTGVTYAADAAGKTGTPILANDGLTYTATVTMKYDVK